jgi:hypothetical protein
VAAAIFSMVVAAACITAPPWLAVSADSRLAAGGALGVVADLADGGRHLLRRGGNLVGLAGLDVGVAHVLNGSAR